MGIATYLLRAGYLVTGGEADPVADGALVVQDGTVSEIGPYAELKARNPQLPEIDCSGQIVTPGLVNAHTHMYGLLSHGIPLAKAPSGFWPFLKDFWWPLIEDRLDHDMIRAATGMACWEMINTGVTLFYDILEGPFCIPGALDVEADVVHKAGIRAILSFEATERVSPENGLLGLAENANFVVRHSSDPMVRGLICFHTTFTCSAEFIKRAHEDALRLGTMLHMHLSEGDFEPKYALEHFGKLPVEYYDELGVLGPHVLASQCVKLQPREMDILAARGVKVSHMPLSNCEVGGGIAPVPELLDRGVVVSLGSDGYINNFFEVMRGAFLIHKASREDPRVMPSRLVWRMATEFGAVSLGWPQLGTLQIGGPADLIAIDADTPTPVEAHNIFDQLVLYRNPQDVKRVIVGGRLVKDNGRVLTLDYGELRAQLAEACRRLWQRAQ